MDVHFYATHETIDGILQGHEMVVLSKENKKPGMIHVSFNLKEYSLRTIVKDGGLYLITKRNDLINTLLGYRL